VAALLRNLRDGASAISLLRQARRIGPAPAPATLVDLALGRRVIRPLQKRAEFLELATLVGECRPRAVLEIGTFRGGTLFAFARLAAPDAVIISIDLPISLLGHVYRLAQAPLFHQFTRADQRLHLLRRDSHHRDTVAAVTRILRGRPLDFLFIDGDHAYASVRADFELYAPLVRPGGLIAFHDIANEPPTGVPRLWEEIRPRFPHREFVHERGPTAMGIGVLEMIAAPSAPRAEDTAAHTTTAGA